MKITFKNILILFFPAIIILFNLNPLRAEDNAPAQGNPVLFKVMIVSLIVWAGIGIFIFYLNRKVNILEKKIDEK